MSNAKNNQISKLVSKGLNNLYVVFQTLPCQREYILDFTSSTSLPPHSLIEHAVTKGVVVETVVAIKACITWTNQRQTRGNPSTIKWRCWSRHCNHNRNYKNN